MPKEHKKRGRRDQKRKLQEEDENSAFKRPKLEDQDFIQEIPYGDQSYDALDNENYVPLHEANRGIGEFYGLLDDEEQAYFKRADQMLELNQFEGPDERASLLESVWTEARGKELKLANSQSCSRLVERLIQLSSVDQLKALFHNFTNHFLALVQHRFASHCCEALFLRSAPIVTEELVAGTRPGSVEDGNASMEQLFLQALDELQGNMGFLMTHRFASHALRVLLLIFSGRSLTDAASQALLKGKNKENIGAVSPMADELNKSELRPVPGTFNKALDNIISGMVGGLDPNYLRALATQPLGNPVLQLLLQIEFGRSGKQKAKDEGSLFRKLLPEMPPDEGTTSALFIRGLLYDPTGSHLLETIVTCSPGKAFKSIYHGQLYDNLRSIVKNENASYVLIKALERLSPGDLQEVLSKISPEISNLIEQSRTSVLRSLIERYHVRKLSDESIEKEISSYFGPPSAASLRNMLGLDAKEVQADPAGGKDREKSLGNRRSHAALLLQKMLEHPGSLRRTVHGALLEATPETLIEAALDKSGTYVVQKSLGCEAQTKGFRRTLLQKFQGRESKLALDMTGAHVLDAFWRATMDLHFLREQIAQQLAKNEEILKESASGRIVRRRWLIDLYVNKRSAWVQKSKRSDLLQDNGENRTNSTELSGQKTSIDMARERFAAKKATKSIWKAPRTHNTTLEGPLSKKYLKPSEDGKLSQRGQQNTTVETPG